MNPWPKDLWQLLNAGLAESEQLLNEMTVVVEDALLELDDRIDEAFAPLADLALQVGVAVEEAMQPLTQTLNPLLNNHQTCVGCRHYHGQVYGDNLLVCGMYPYGCETPTCPDWEALW
jgi:hypothetical protein